MNTGIERRVRIEFLEPVLGTSPNNKEIYTEYIASKAPTIENLDAELDAIPEDSENGITVFPRTKDGKPGFWPYQIRGFFKSGQQMMNDLVTDREERKKKTSGYLSTYKRRIDEHVFVKAVDSGWRTQKKLIEIHMPDEAGVGFCERPLRAQTMQGERVALAKSESIPEGSWLEFDVLILDPKLEKNLIEWLEFGCLNGLGPWRNSGKGTFVYTMTDKDGTIISSNAE